MSARQLIATAVLSDAQIGQIEKVSKQFQRGDDEDLCYAVNFSVLISLSGSDKFKAIEYGKQSIKKLESSSTPRSNYFMHAFLINSGCLIGILPYSLKAFNSMQKN